jgi:carboxyl-terminal processing protease
MTRIRKDYEDVMREKSPFYISIASVILAGLFLVSVAFGSGFVFASVQPPYSPARSSPVEEKGPLSTGPLSLFQEAWDLIKRDFYGPLPSTEERGYGAVRGLLSTLDDPYTVFIEPIPHQFEQDSLRGSYGGVGMTLEYDADGQVVLSPFRDSPAAQAGILLNDVLLAVDDLLITPEMDISQDIVARIRGKVGTDVVLTVQRGDETLTFTITRQVIDIPSVTWRLLEQAPTLGYVHVSSFTDRTVDELEEALDELLSSGAQGLILDLRGNGGGLLQAAIDVAGHFLDGGEVLYEKRRGQVESHKASEGGRALEIPLVVLVNQGTASASEIVAGAIQDRGRGKLIGETTFGKGSVQWIFNLSDGSSLHVTAARWYTPNHHQLDGVGLTPDLVVETDPDSGVDVQLERAITFLQE